MTDAEYARRIRERLCFCGSMLPKNAEYDARGIFITYACTKCRKYKLSGYRANVLADSDYWHDGPIGSE
jgi:hypothetical protein